MRARKSSHCISLFAAAFFCGGGFAQQTGPEQLIQGGHWKRARALVESSSRQAGDEALTSFLQSQVRYAFGDHSAPLALAERAVSLNGHVAKYHRQVAEALGVQAEHAGPLQQIFLARRFRKEIGAAIDLDPRDVQARRDLLEFYLLAPAIVGGNSRKAADVAEQIAEIDAPEGFLAKARIAMFHKHINEGGALLRSAAEARPTSYRAQIELARFCLDPEHLDRGAAEKTARKALDLDRTRAEAYNVLVGIYVDRAEWASLDSILKEASRQNPDDPAPFFYAADHLLSAGLEPAGAERYLRVYLGQKPEGNEPQESEAHWKLGVALEAQGRTMEAIAEWKQSVQLDPTSKAARELKRILQ